jgi:glycosyltransferase involved in cell wall biosynthesis
MSIDTNRIAIVTDWLIDFWWAELVISHLLEMYPEADIFTSVCFMEHPMLEGRRVYTSWIQRIPFLNRKHKLAGILRPWAFRSFDLSKYDIIISSSSAEAKNAGFSKRKPWAKHFCYCHTPTRYYWSHAKEYEDMMEFGFWNPFVKSIFRLVKWWMQKVDYEAARKVDFFIANSRTTTERIKKYYNRESEVIYPGVDLWSTVKSTKYKVGSTETLNFELWTLNSYYLWLGRCIPYKRLDLLVDAFNQNGKNLILCTATDTALYHELKAKSKSNIEWRFRVSNEEKNELMANAKAFLFPPEEDFGLVPVEAMMSGIPVIAYGKWGGTESVVDGETGIFFTPQTPEALNEAIEKFETLGWDKERIRARGMEFSKKVFQQKIQNFIKKYAK